MTYIYSEMINSVSLDGIIVWYRKRRKYKKRKQKKKRKKIFFSLWWELLGFTPNTFAVCHAAVLTIAVMLHIPAHPALIYLVNWKLVLWPPASNSPLPCLQSLVVTDSVFFYESEFLLLFFHFLDSTYKWDHMVFVFLCLIYFI